MDAPQVNIGEVVVRAALFKTLYDNKPEPWEGNPLDLLGRHRILEAKEDARLFSTVEYKEGEKRGKEGILRAHAMVFDFDHLSAVDAERVLDLPLARGWAHIAFTTYRHHLEGSDDWRFRILLLPSRAILPGEFPVVWASFNAIFRNLADPVSKGIEHIFYLPSCPSERSKDAWIRPADGALFDVDQLVMVSPLPGKTEKKEGRVFHEGERNAGLTRIGGALRRKGAGQDELLAALLAANDARCVPPLPLVEVEVIVSSLLKYDPASPFLNLNLTDAGNAERFKAFAGDRFAYVHPWRSWFRYDDRRWRRDEDETAVLAALQTLRSLACEASKLDDDKLRQRIARHALVSEGRARITAMLALAQALCPVGLDAFDTNPDLLNVANGTLDLRTGELRPHRQDDWITRVVPVAWNPDAKCPLWERFLDRIMGGNNRLKDFLARAVGYGLSGHAFEQVIFLLYGTGSNGKSTFIEIIRAILGDYAAVADFRTFEKRDSDGARNDLARLFNMRFVSAIENGAGKTLDEALIKQLTGGDTITARFLFQEFFEYRPIFKVFMAANHKPVITGADLGIWRRVLLVPFTTTIPKNERDKELPRKLAEELPGILAWAVRGGMAWRAEGLAEPAEVVAATADYREEMDFLSGFLNERCSVEDGAWVTSKELYSAYMAWCDSNGEKPKTQKALANSLIQRGFAKARASDARGWNGLRLRR